MKLTVLKKKADGATIIRDEALHIVATFAAGPQGQKAYDYFFYGMAMDRSNSLFDFNTNEFLIGGPNAS